MTEPTKPKSMMESAASRVLKTWQWQALQHEPHERPYRTALMLVVGRAIYFVTLLGWTYLFFLLYSDIFAKSHARLSLMPAEMRTHFHFALLLALAVALFLGRPWPNAWTYLKPPIAVPVYVLRVLVGLHSVRLFFFALWLSCGYGFLWFTELANPAAFGVAFGCLLMILFSMFHGLAKRFAKPPESAEALGEPSIVWREDLGPERSNSPLTIAQLPERIAMVWMMNMAALRGRR
jgi:hypothetical protein